MQLAQFIGLNHEAILVEWEAFARTLTPAADGLTKAGLRDHADEILSAITLDMRTLESAADVSAKSQGHPSEAHQKSGSLSALGQLHAILRIESGFTLSQVVAEYRALRASVLRLWDQQNPDPRGVLRFNESIDEALAEAVDRYTQKTDQYRDQLIGIVSHDLRNPLGGILMGAGLLSQAEALDARSARIASGIENSAKRMVRIVGDLLDLTRCRLGLQIPIVRGPTDVGGTCEMIIAELEGSHPGAVIRFVREGDLRGEWDDDRLAQTLSNLVGNALQHGDTDRPVTVTALGEADQVMVSVHNFGAAIPEAALQEIFEPMVRHLEHPGRASTGLGLGLYIAKQLVSAHGGEIRAVSSESAGTTFRLCLPRRAPPLTP